VRPLEYTQETLTLQGSRRNWDVGRELEPVGAGA
jgi:hypothetical protein